VNNNQRDHAVIVLGHREQGISREHRISRESLMRLRVGEACAARERTLCLVLTGYTSTGGLSEAEQMAAARALFSAPALLEVAGRNTSENASRSLPLLVATGRVRRVTVVTSWWHWRAWYFFAPYRRHGMGVRIRPVFTRGGWRRMLHNEWRSARLMRRERREAFAELERAMIEPDA